MYTVQEERRYRLTGITTDVQSELRLHATKTRGERIVLVPIELRVGFLDGGWSNTSTELLLLQELGKKISIFAVGFPAFVVVVVVVVANHFGSRLIVFVSAVEQAQKSQTSM